eukprot:m.122395 g.122395  ORF g.122395 m.122395 type:complete len:447 (+) comp9626_c0_seq3:995-2335(+)
MHRRLCSRPLSVDLQKDGERQQQCEPKIGHMEAELRPEHRDEDQANHAGTCGHCPVEPQKRHGRAATRCRGCCRAGCAQATSHWSAAMLSASEKAHLLRQLVLVGAIQVVFFLGLKWLLKSTDPQSSRKAEGAVAGKRLMDRLARKGVKLSEYENMIACDVVDPADLTVGWEGVGGLEKTIATLKENIVLPFTRPDLFNSRLRRAPKGVLLFGPPGCGKTMTAKALAKECGCTFINLQPSTFMDKWYGESQKLIDALFSIAEKLQPCIIFIDEIDSFLRERQSADNEASAITKAQFMALWDGFATNAHQIVVVGATNRPFDVDKAILRRLPLTIHVKLPDAVQRESILRVLLHDENLAQDVDIQALAALTTDFSGSDLEELCRNVAMRALRAALHSGNATAAPDDIELAPLCMADFVACLGQVKHAHTENQPTPFGASELSAESLD